MMSGFNVTAVLGLRRDDVRLYAAPRNHAGASAPDGIELINQR